MISAGIRQMADVNIRVFLAFLQDRSDVWPATGPWGSTNGTVALANSEQKFAKWQIDFADIFLRDLVDGQGKTRNANMSSRGVLQMFDFCNIVFSVRRQPRQEREGSRRKTLLQAYWLKSVPVLMSNAAAKSARV
jgi:hypothetical protein